MPPQKKLHARPSLRAVLRGSNFRSVVLVVSALGASTGAAQVGTRDAVPVPMPERPFVLLDAPRRFLPSEPSEVRLQVRDGGEVRLSVFRVDDPSSMLGQAGRRQGVSIASGSLGAEAERLVAASGALPRAGRGLALVREDRVAMPRPEGLRRVWNEASVYDSNEDVEDGVATYWVRDGNWSVRRVSLGALPAGLYLVQVRAAAWVASALLSVGELVVMARRGDREDVVWVADAEGAPQPGIAVRALAGDRALSTATTGADGVARFAASGAASLRFRADRGADVAWADVAHVRLAPCDPRVYVATGPPLHRPGERMFVRGHVRGCAGDGYGPLANRVLVLASGGERVEARSDARGDFVAELVASEEIVATLDGREHRRSVRIDDRTLPLHELVVEPDRPWAAAGEIVEVRVADREGGWPHEADVMLEAPSGRLMASIGPSRPAVFHVRIPPEMADTARRLALHASVSAPGRVTMASAEIFVGRSRVQLELAAERERGARDEVFALVARASDLGGAPVSGAMRIAVYGSDGNRALGAPRHRAEGMLDAGRAALRVPLPGAGPWMLRAEHAGARAELVVWERARPPALGERGDVAVLPLATRARPGDSLSIDVRLPEEGAAWLTLEQGGVLVSHEISSARPGASRVQRVDVALPDRARGLASVVLSHVHRGRVRTASASVEVETSRPLELEVGSDRAVYGRGARARVTIEAKTEGVPRDAVVSLWLADAGYWGLGEDSHPLPAEYLRLPGRPASGADSSAPVAFGAEEGRRLDSELVLDARTLDGATHRHGWRHGGEVVRVSARGRLSVIAGAIARAAGLRGARVVRCDDVAQHSLRARDLPWDLVALRVAEALSADVSVEEGGLVFECGAGRSVGGLGMSGSGAGGGGSGLGTIGGGALREERLEGTLHFVGLRALGPDGRLELEVPLPDHPGRWRVEVLAIADDGGGARAHRVVTTRDRLEAWLDAPRTLRVGDRAEGVIHVESRDGARSAEVELRVPPSLRLVRAPASTVPLDDRGRAALRFGLEAISEGTTRVELTVRAAGASDAVRAELRVLPASTERVLFVAALIDERANDVEVPMPALATGAELVMRHDGTLEREAEELLRALLAPRWDIGIARVDRLVSLAALRRVAAAQGASELLARVQTAMDAEVHALRAMPTSTGEIGWMDRGDPALTLEVLEHVPASEWTAARAQVRDRLDRGELHGESAARAARVLLGRAEAEAVLERASRESASEVRALTEVVRAARTHGLGAIERDATMRLVAAVDARIGAQTPPRRCGGWPFVFCSPRGSERGVLARAALVLGGSNTPRGRGMAARVGAWIARQPATHVDFVWGSDEADVLELVAAHARGNDPAIVLVDGRRVPFSEGRFTVPAGEHRVVLRFAERRGRLRRVVVQGGVRLSAPTNALGNVELVRGVDRRSGEWEAFVAFALPESARDVLLTVPIPAGFTVDQRRLTNRGALLVDGAMRVRFEELARGPHELRIPLVSLGSGSFVAGPASLDAGPVYGLTPALRVDVAP